MTRLNQWHSPILLVALLCASVYAAPGDPVPHDFKDGDVISASEMNDNFEELSAQAAALQGQLDGAPALNLNYSTTEAGTGRTWIDGKAIYSRTLPFNLTDGAQVSLTLGDHETVVQIHGIAQSGGGGWFKLGYGDSTLGVQANCNTDGSCFVNAPNFTQLDGYVIVHYTKP